MVDPRHPTRKSLHRRAAASAPPPPKAPKGKGREQKRAHGLLQRLKRRRAIRRDLRRMRIVSGLRTKAKKRKMALALGASAVGLNTAAVSAFPVERVQIAQNFEDPRQVRISSDKISVSDEMKLALIEEEGIHREVYADPIGLLTVGVGHLVTPKDGLRAGDRISDAKMVDLLDQDLDIAKQAVVDLVGDLPLYQHEFDALVDLVFNVGAGNVSPDKSPRLNAAIAAGDYEAIAEQLAYHNAAGERLNGLELRSDRREAIFLDANYENPREVATTRS